MANSVMPDEKSFTSRHFWLFILVSRVEKVDLYSANHSCSIPVQLYENIFFSVYYFLR